MDKMFWIKLAAIVTFIGVAYGYGYHKGTVDQVERQEDARVALQEELFDLNEDLNLKAAEILQLQREREDLINDLENAALNAPGASNGGVATTGGLQRLERRWGPSPTSSN